MARCIALIVAAGRGARFGGDVPKQYTVINGRYVLAHTLETFLQHPLVEAVRVVIHPDDKDRYEAVVGTVKDGTNLLPPVFGARTRQQSVRNGLESLHEHTPDTVLIHDGARPFVSAHTISRVLGALDEAEGALPALPVVDTLKRTAPHAGEYPRIEETVPRENVWRVQTPQGFRFTDILKAHKSIKEQSLSDDAAVAQAAGLRVVIVPGDDENFKLTTPEDALRASMMSTRHVGGEEYRIGNGYDVHRFADGDRVYLCGTAIPFTRSLRGHSDADVALHALCDALLGAIGEGDIGTHFPPSDSRWKDARSDRFVRFASERIARRGGRVINVDVTIICEAPKIGPHRETMRQTLAQILRIEAERVSIKATTTEGLGFCGRGEGIAAQASVQITLPTQRRHDGT